jgi:hypothetical protein
LSKIAKNHFVEIINYITYVVWRITLSKNIPKNLT